ncbi:hypothetical protein LQG66_24725 [Bradyrhizobium ontarionense]|uniref:PH domain-containing protein n=1 Tax=Bradyrhizobium ontarionense TaxID=2898149 RepID=A0ABY3R6U4_9BRAD|nr:hypothetical protein [Bradyrhizobium sp. A19]UFZ02478.1 hypothetical protein LQG66_24725 [Bradyrhizobium sp. A19]
MAVWYRHRQWGGVAIATCLGSGALGAVLLWNAGHGAVAVALLVTELVIAVLFSSLTVEVGDGELRWFFGPGLWRHRVALDAITAIAVVRNRWWHGLGVGIVSGIRFYTVSGLDAVELCAGNDDLRRIGTDDPHGLAAAIRAACASQQRTAQGA